MADLATVLEKLSLSLPYVQTMVVAFSYLAGFTLMFASFYKLKQYGELRSMMSLQTDLRGPVVSIFVAAILVYLPTALKIMMNSFFGYGSPIAYEADESNRWSQTVSIVVYFTQIMGLIAFVKGWIVISRVANKSSQNATFGKGVIHIFGGLVAININGTVALLNATLGTSIGFSPTINIGT